MGVKYYFIGGIEWCDFAKKVPCVQYPFANFIPLKSVCFLFGLFLYESGLQLY